MRQRISIPDGDLVDSLEITGPIIYIFTNRTPVGAGAIDEWMNFVKVFAYKIIKAPIPNRSAQLGSDQVSGAMIRPMRW